MTVDGMGIGTILPPTVTGTLPCFASFLCVKTQSVYVAFPLGKNNVEGI
jgi:hypothetical protein